MEAVMLVDVNIRGGLKVKVLSAQLCLTLCDPMDYSPPGSSVPGILQTRILEGFFCHALLQEIFPTQVSCIAGEFSTV